MRSRPLSSRRFATAEAIKGPFQLQGGGSADYGRNKLRRPDRTLPSRMGRRAWCGCGVTDDKTLDSPVAKFMSDSEQAELVVRLGGEPGDLLLMIADD
ncbi:MAG: GAD domain-containing protein [Acidimicrobiales bacterium]